MRILHCVHTKKIQIANRNNNHCNIDVLQYLPFTSWTCDFLWLSALHPALCIVVACWSPFFLFLWRERAIPFIPIGHNSKESECTSERARTHTHTTVMVFFVRSPNWLHTLLLLLFVSLCFTSVQFLCVVLLFGNGGDSHTSTAHFILLLLFIIIFSCSVSLPLSLVALSTHSLPLACFCCCT